MNAKDLRIGNCVLLDTGLTLPDFHIIRANDIQVIDDKILKDISIEPIPLTEDVLLKYGFENLSEDWYEINLFDGTRKLSINLNEGWAIGDEDYIREVVFNGTMHLHQLQNLYFALTGKEL